MKNKNIEQWNEFSQIIEKNFGANLIQIALYNRNSETGNLIVISEVTNYSNFDSVQKEIKKILKKDLPMPLFITRKYIESSLDSFPLEFININKDYENLFVKNDILEHLFFRQNDVRLAIERELKSKWIHIQSNFLELHDKKKGLLKLLQISISGILPILEGFLFIKNLEVPSTPMEIIQLCDNKTDFSIATFKKVFEVTQNQKKSNLFELQELFKNYLFEIEELIKYIDSFK